MYNYCPELADDFVFHKRRTDEETERKRKGKEGKKEGKIMNIYEQNSQIPKESNEEAKEKN